MRFIPNNLYHIYNRGNNQQRIFFNRENYLFFLKKIKKGLTPHCRILAWCLMPNHFHLMVYYPEALPNQPLSDNFESDNFGVMQPLTRSIAILVSSYAKAINKQQHRTGSLFQQKTKAKLLTENKNTDYPFVCFHYIHQNPLKAGLVRQSEDWEFSSFRDYAGLRNGALVDKESACRFLDISVDPLAFRKHSYRVMTNNDIAKVF